jgi:hypothetical protein
MSAFVNATRARLQWLGVAVVALAVLVGCTAESGGYNTTSPPKIRFFNAAFDIGAIDADVGTVQTITGLNYEQFATYHSASLGSQPVTILQTGTTTPLITSSVNFDNGQRWTHILYGRPNAPQALIVADNVELSGGGKYKVRLVNAATESGPLDVYVTAPGAVIDTMSPTLAGVTLGGVSDYVELDAGSVEVRIVPSGTKSVFYDSGQITLSERNAYSLVAYNRGDPGQVNVGLLTHDTLGSGSLQNSGIGKVRVVNATPAVPSLNVASDGTALFTGVAYGSATPYGVTAAGAHTVTVQASGAPNVDILNGGVTFPPGGDATFVIYGNPGSLIGVTLSDANFLPMTTGNARVRVVNAGTGLGAVGTYINGALAVGTLPVGSTSLYFELAPATYAVSFVDTASSGVVLAIPAVTLAANHTYTLLLIGTPTAPAYVLTQDR